MRAVERTESIIGSGSRAIGKGINGIFRWTVDMVFLGIRVMWNSCWILIYLFTAGFAFNGFIYFVCGKYMDKGMSPECV